MPNARSIDAETKLLGAMAYGESSTMDSLEEMSAIASVLVRQTKARGYSSIKELSEKDKTFSFVVVDGNPRFQLMFRSSDASIHKSVGMSLGLAAAENALNGGLDYSNGAYLWDGLDLKINYATHFKVRHGISFSKPAHNIFHVKESKNLVVVTKTVTRRVGNVRTKQSEELYRFDHIYESTSAAGGSVFWRHSPGYMRSTGAKEYK